jgi:signal transduction histidine kinase
VFRREDEAGGPVSGRRGWSYPGVVTRAWSCRITASLEQIVDVAIAVTLSVLSLVSIAFPDSTVVYTYPDPTALSYVLVLCACLPLAGRRRWPGPVFAGTLTASLAVAVPGWNTGMLPVALIVALYSVAAYGTRVVAVIALLYMYAGMGLLVVLRVPYFDSPWVVLNFGAYTVFWVLGLVAQSIRHNRELALNRAVEAERTKAMAAANARTAERLRIARDLHDVVAHTLSVVSIQAGAARHLMREHPDDAVGAITAVEAAARTAMDDLRRMLGVMRDGPPDKATMDPSPGRREIDELVSAHTGPITLDVTGPVDALPDSVRLTVFRVVQESLTNARKYAPGSQVSVAIAAEDGLTEVQVSNRPPREPVNGSGAGWGLAGLRERVALFNGSLEAGPSQDGGYAVRARLLTPDGGAT